MKRIFSLLLTLCLLLSTLALTACGPSGGLFGDPEDSIGGITGTAAAKILLARSRLKESDLTDSANLLKNEEALEQSLAAFRQGTAQLLSQYEETSNTASYFENIQTVVSSTAQQMAELIRMIKTEIRVVGKWIVFDENASLLLTVDAEGETIYEKHEYGYLICKRTQTSSGKDRYEIFREEDTCTSRLIYIPDEYFQMGNFFPEENSDPHVVIGDKSNGYWTLYEPRQNGQYIGSVLTGTVCYQFDVSPEANGTCVTVISGDRECDILRYSSGSFSCMPGAFNGIEEITAPAGNWGGMRLSNGTTVQMEDTFVGGKMQFNGAVNAESPEFILITQTSDLEGQLADFSACLQEMGLTCRRNLSDVLNGLRNAAAVQNQFEKSYVWNGYPATKPAEGLRAEKASFPKFREMLSDAESLEKISVNDQDALNANIDFLNVSALNPGTVSYANRKITVANLTLTAQKGALLEKNEAYTVVLALAGTAGGEKSLASSQKGGATLLGGLTPLAGTAEFSSMIPLQTESTATAAYNGEGDLTVTLSAAFDLPRLDVGSYTLVAYLATAEGIRVSKPAPVLLSSALKDSGAFPGTDFAFGAGSDGAVTVTYSANGDLVVSVEAKEEGYTYEELKTMMEAKLPEGAMIAQDALLYAGDGTEDGWTALDPAATGLEGPIYRVTVTAADASEILLYVQITAK